MLAFVSVPRDDRQASQHQPAGTNGEIKRRTEVVSIFANEEAITRLVDAILLEQNDEWAVQRARYMKCAIAHCGPLPVWPPVPLQGRAVVHYDRVRSALSVPEV